MDMHITTVLTDPDTVSHNFIIIYALLYTTLNNLATLTYTEEVWHSIITPLSSLTPYWFLDRCSIWSFVN